MLSQDIVNRKTVRKYQDKEVPRDVINDIFSKAIYTSSSGNMQPYSIIVTTDKKVKKELYDTLDQQSMVAEAPCFVTFCADFNRMRKWLKLNDAPMNFDNFLNFMIGNFDATLLSQSASLIAEEKGLGICYVGSIFYRCFKVAKILNLPKYVVPIVGYSLGYPDEKPTKKDRLPLDGVIHYDTYKDYSDQDIKEIYKDKEKTGWERYTTDEWLKKEVEKYGVENLAQIYTKVKYQKEDHDEASMKIIEFLKEQFIDKL